MSNTDLDFVLKVDGLVYYCLTSNEQYFLSVFRMRSSCTLYIFLNCFQHLIWRKTENIDQILVQRKMPEVVRKYYPGGHCGFDKEGCPIWIDPIGNIDPKGRIATVNYLLCS